MLFLIRTYKNCTSKIKKSNTVNIYLFKINYGNTRRMSNLFKVHNNDTRTASTLFWCLYCQTWTDLTHSSDATIINFEQVNASWDCMKLSSYPLNVDYLVSNLNWLKFLNFRIFIFYILFIISKPLRYRIRQFNRTIIIRCNKLVSLLLH